MTKNNPLTIKSEAPSLRFAQCEDGTLEVSDPDNEVVAWYFTPQEAVELGQWLIEEFSEALVAQSKGQN